MSNQPRHHKPVMMPDLEHLDPQPDPATRAEAAHETAALLVAGRSGERDPAATARFVRLADEIGLEAIAEIWSSAPAVSLPGTLWRLYALRSWIRRSPVQASQWYDAGRQGTTVSEVIAGVEEPPGPDSVARAADEILAGAFTGDYATALARAAAFVFVSARGRETLDEADSSIESFEDLGRDLAAAARAHRHGRLG